MRFPTCSKFGQRHWIVNYVFETELKEALRLLKLTFGWQNELTRKQKNKFRREAIASTVRKLVYSTLADWRERFPNIGCEPITIKRNKLNYVYMRNPITHNYEWRRNNCLDESFLPNQTEALRMVKLFTQNMWDRHSEGFTR